MIMMKVFIDTNIFLVTRNIKDYGFAKMEVLVSQTFLAKYK